MTLGHRVAVLREGRLQQCDTPRRLYEHPCNVFVAGFVGSPAMNLDRLPFDGTAARAGEVGIPLPGAAAAAARQAGLSEVVLGLRPESLSRALDGGGDGATLLSGAVHLVEDTGADAWVHVDAPGGSSALRLVALADTRRLPTVGDRIVLAVRVGEAHVFNPATGERLGD